MNFTPLATISGYLGATVPTYNNITATIAGYLGATVPTLKALLR